MQTAVTALRVLDVVAEHQPIGVTEVARRMGMPKSSAQRALGALDVGGWIRPSGGGDRAWVLSTKAIDVARRVAADAGVRDAAQGVLVDLRDATGESVHLAIREGHEVVVIDVVETGDAVRIHIPVGTRSPLHATATGKAILAHLDPVTREQILSAALPRLTDETITDRDELDAQLEAIRTGRSLAVAQSELREDISSIAAPVLSSSGAPLCAISVFIPSYRFPADGGARVGEHLRSAVARVESRFTAPGHRSPAAHDRTPSMGVES